MSHPNLTMKQEKFCQKYIELDGNASDAYRSSYNCENMKPETINRKAHALLKNGKIGARIKELQAKIEKKHEVTIDSLILELEEARKHSLKDEKGGRAATDATMAKAKLMGFVDRHHGKPLGAGNEASPPHEDRPHHETPAQSPLVGALNKVGAPKTLQ